MGKKHSNKKGEFVELKDDQVPEHIKEAIGDKDVKAISGRERDFVNLQKDLHENFYNMKLVESELQVFMDQLKLPISEREMKWNGMIIPDQVLKARTGKKNIDYISLIHYVEGAKKNLLSQGLTQDQMDIVMLQGKYVKELPKLKINTGEILK